MKIQEVLKKYFGYEIFKPGQEQIIRSIMQGRDTLGIMPTGGGKSVCYQIPALMLPGTTLVISPLIALMKDQVDALNNLGLPAAYISSALSQVQVQERLRAASCGEYKMLYIAPERLSSDNFNNLFKTMQISMIAIDEAHCVSQWGHDFRPSYAAISPWIAEMEQRPVIASFTATATLEVRGDIVNLLGLKQPNVYVSGFDRENLNFSVVKGIDKIKFITQYIKAHKEQAGIIYAATRREVDGIYEQLHKNNFLVGRYHAGMKNEDRSRNQEDFIYDKIQIMVATNAFGMGIDKSNIRYVFHHNMPRNMESYYQEAGRAGRDGQPGECILLYSPADIHIQKFLIEQTVLSEDRKNWEYRKLQTMVDYCNSTRCLRQYILEYFGEEDVAESCDNCGNCNCDYESRDITIEAQKIFSCIKRMHEQYGIKLVASVLKGSKMKRVQELRFDKLSTYGIMSDLTIPDIIELTNLLGSEDYLYSTGGQYPVIRLTDKAVPVLRSQSRVIVRMPRVPVEAAADSEIFQSLRSLRLDIAQREEVPPYVIFHDRTLREMSERLPLDENAMLSIQGMGEIKLEKYGQEFLNLLNSYAANKELSAVTVAKEEKVKKTASRDKTASHIVSWEMYRDGKSMQEIADQREMKILTVQEHILRSAREGYIIDWFDFFDEKEEELILKTIKEVGSGKLNPIKEVLPDSISYLTIKAVLCKMAINKDKLQNSEKLLSN